MPAFIWMPRKFRSSVKLVEKESVYIAIGITEDKAKEVLHFTIAPTESSQVWGELI